MTSKNPLLKPYFDSEELEEEEGEYVFICKGLRIYKRKLKMIERGYIIERIKSLPEESIKEVANFIEFLDAKRKRLVEEEGGKKEKEGERRPLIQGNRNLRRSF